MKKTLLLALLLAVSAIGCQKDELDIENVSDLNAYLADEMDFQRIPALTALLFNNQGIVHEVVYGYPEVTNSAGLNPNDLFLLASVSKVVTAVALLQLYDDGHFELDDPINPHLPFNVAVPGYNTPITFRMLLTHTSGIADGDALDAQYFYGEDSPNALTPFLQSYLVPGGQYYNADQNFYNFEPGTQHEYSNVGCALIGALVESISGQNFNTYCKQNIFQPLGMNDTYWRLDEAQQSGNRLVMPYDYTNGGYQAIGHYTFTDYPNGGLRSTARDLHRLLDMLASGGTYNGNEVLSPQTVSAMLTPQIPQLDNTMGLHVFLMNANNNLWGHDGGEQGVATIMAFNPSNGAGAIILTNQGDADLDEMLVECYKLALKL